MKDTKSPRRPAEDERSLDELLSFINNTKRPSKGKSGSESSATSTARVKKKQRKREKKMRQREEREREERERVERDKASVRAEAESASTTNDYNNNHSKERKCNSNAHQEDEGSNGPAMPEEKGTGLEQLDTGNAPNEDAAPPPSTGSKLAAKLAQFTEFPQFWEEEDDLDPDQKAEQDRYLIND